MYEYVCMYVCISTAINSDEIDLVRWCDDGSIVVVSMVVVVVLFFGRLQEDILYRGDDLDCVFFIDLPVLLSPPNSEREGGTIIETRTRLSISHPGYDWESRMSVLAVLYWKTRAVRDGSVYFAGDDEITERHSYRVPYPQRKV